MCIVLGGSLGKVQAQPCRDTFRVNLDPARTLAVVNRPALCAFQIRPEGIMPQTADLFGKQPRRPRRVLMSVTDVLTGCCGDYESPVRIALACRVCGHTCEAIETRPVTHPCPVCSPPTPSDKP